MNHFDTLIIGAGPAGSTAAREIAKAGYSVCMFEKDSSPGQTNVCAGGFPKSMTNELGLAADVIEKTIVGTDHYFPWGLESRSLSEKDHQATAYRSVLDKAIADKAVLSGAELRTLTLVKDVIKKNGKIQILAENLISKE